MTATERVERSRPHWSAAAPLSPVSTLEAAFIEYEMGLVRGLVDPRSALRALAGLALNELYALSITDENAFPLFTQYLEKAVRARLGPDAPPFELRGRDVLGELEAYLKGAAIRFLRRREMPAFVTEQEVEAMAEEVACELVVIAAKAFFRFYGLMRWIR